MRGKPDRGSRKLDTSAIRAAMRDRRYWVGLGLVWVPPDESSHWEIDDDVGVLVHVKLMPDEEPLACRLGGLGEGGSNGIWRVPPVGSEVAVGLVGGVVDGDCMLLCVLASGGVPDELDEDTLVVRGPKVVIIADGVGAAVEVGAKGLDLLLDGVVHGRGVDSFTGASYAALGSGSTTLRAKK